MQAAALRKAKSQTKVVWANVRANAGLRAGVRGGKVLKAMSGSLHIPPARLIGEDGAPVAGTFFGPVANPAFLHLNSAYQRTFLERKLVEKKWQYLHVATPEMMLSAAIIDTGYLASGFCAVFDRGARRLLVDENEVLPPLCVSINDEPNDGLSARLLGPGVDARIERGAGRVLFSAHWGYGSVELSLDARKAPKPLSAVAKLGEGRFNFTQKIVGIPAEGEVRAGNHTYLVQGQLAGLDYTHGYLLHETAWHWAFASGRAGNRALGLNLSQGFLDAAENAVWVDGTPATVGPVRFTFDAATPLSPWRIKSDDGGLDLTFQPEGLRARNIDLKLIMSRYAQPFGTFSGHITSATGERLAIVGLAGITEDHAARW